LSEFVCRHCLFHDLVNDFARIMVFLHSLHEGGARLLDSHLFKGAESILHVGITHPKQTFNECSRARVQISRHLVSAGRLLDLEPLDAILMNHFLVELIKQFFINVVLLDQL